MPINQPMKIDWPHAGVSRRSSFRGDVDRKGPFPTPWSLNCRSEGVISERLRGGSFTGIAAAARPASTVYRDRTITFSGRAITASRVGDSSDTAFSSDVSDLLRPALFQLAEAGEQGPNIVAVASHKDSHLICWTATETWILRGDPLNGSRTRVSDEVGIVGADAWTVAHDTVYFLSSRGLYSVGADGSGLKALSEDVLPVDLDDVSDATATLTYQHSDRGVYIYTTGTDWLYAREAFWPFDTSTTESHVLLGPFYPGQGTSFGRILSLHGNIAASSVDVTWRIVTGDTAGAAAANGKLAIEADVLGNDFASYVSQSGTWSAGRAHMAYPRTRALFFVLWLSAPTGNWEYETVAFTKMQSGLWR